MRYILSEWGAPGSTWLEKIHGYYRRERCYRRLDVSYWSLSGRKRIYEIGEGLYESCCYCYRCEREDHRFFVVRTSKTGEQSACEITREGADWIADRIDEWVIETSSLRSADDAPIAKFCERMPRDFWETSSSLVLNRVGFFRRVFS